MNTTALPRGITLILISHCFLRATQKDLQQSPPSFLRMDGNICIDQENKERHTHHPQHSDKNFSSLHGIYTKFHDLLIQPWLRFDFPKRKFLPSLTLYLRIKLVTVTLIQGAIVPVAISSQITKFPKECRRRTILAFAIVVNSRSNSRKYINEG